MSDTELISVVIPCYTRGHFVHETIESIQRQTHTRWEVILVDDGAEESETVAAIETLERQAPPGVRIVREPHRGLPHARNRGFHLARGRYVIPLDSDDLLEPEMMETCLRAMRSHPEAGFAHCDYRVFGDKNFIRHAGDYNLYRLMHENFLAYCLFLRREAWQDVGGYDEWHRFSYEDWQFALQLGAHGWYGHYIPKVLFNYRTHGRGHHYVGLDNHDKNWAHMTASHPSLFSPNGRLSVKRRWSPAICFVVQSGEPNFENQTVQDYQVLVDVDEATALEQSNAPCFLWMSEARTLHPHAAEQCIWGLRSASWVTWSDTGEAPRPSFRQAAGPLGLSRAVLAQPETRRSGKVRRLPWRCRRPAEPPETRTAQSPRRPSPSPSNKSTPTTPPTASTRRTEASTHWPAAIRRHLENAELLSTETWLTEPLAAAGRLIPLRFKEKINAVAGRPVFDLSFYLRFQPRSVLIEGGLVERIDYMTPPKSNGRRRLALCTPSLGAGGAETVLLELAGRIDRSRFEVFLLAADRQDSRLESRWENLVDHIYDLAPLVDVSWVPHFIYSAALNWEFDVLVVQNSLSVYSALPAIKEKRPEIKTVDILHAVDDDWDLFSATLDVADDLDRRVVISEAGRARLFEMDTPEERIRLIRNGIDVRRFEPSRYVGDRLHHELRLAPGTRILLYAGALHELKRPLLLADIAAQLVRLRTNRDFHFVVAGTGPEERRLRAMPERKGLTGLFSPLGYREDMPELLASSSLLLVPSQTEGVPLIVLESLAMETPVVASHVGAIEEALPPECGILVELGSEEEARFARAIDDLLGDEQRRRAMGQAGRRLVARDYTLDRARRQYSELLNEL